MPAVNKKGFTLMEILIVLALLAMLLFLFLWRYSHQINKANDAKRKDDLDRLRITLQEYYEDYQCFPRDLSCGQTFMPYLEAIPCDPKAGGIYKYLAEPAIACPGWFKIYARLDNENDPAIARAGCTGGVDPTGEGIKYNYGVSSSNVAVCEAAVLPSPSGGEPGEPPAPSGSPAGCWPITACLGEGEAVECNFIDPAETQCSVYFCNDNCAGGCKDEAGQPIAEKQCQP